MRELIRKALNEHVGDLSENFRSTDTFPSFIRQQLEKIYKPLGMWGKAPNPSDDCNTNVGVINIFPHSDEDVWSVLNRFDTNSKVKDKLTELFKKTNPENEKDDQAFRGWIETNANDLFGPNGVHTEELVTLNMTTIISGNNNEKMAVDILKNKFPGHEIKRYCSGDIRDTKKGIDISIEKLGSENITIQVKTFEQVKSYAQSDGDTFFEVKSYLDANRYIEKNVKIFMFVNYQTKEYISFENDKNKIGQMRNNITRFYEPPLFTNMTFVTKEKTTKKKSSVKNLLFSDDAETLKNLEFRKAQIERMIEKIQKKFVNTQK
jgi:hypothetical protein